jgi:hypothetical protein
VFAAQFEKMAEGWRRGVVELEFAVQTARSNVHAEVQRELRFTQAAGIVFQSVANQAYFIQFASTSAVPLR